MKLKNLFGENDDSRGVSPVIGVILMVAITVILAAVIGTFVLGLGDDINQEVNAGVTINENTGNNSITVSWTSQGNADGIGVRGDGNADPNNITTVGESITVWGLDADDTVNVVAYADSSDGSLEEAERTTVIRSWQAGSGYDGS